MRDCENVDIRDLLPEHAGGLLAGAERARVEAHLATCEACRAELALLRALRASRPTPRVTAADVSRIVAALPKPTRAGAPSVPATPPAQPTPGGGSLEHFRGESTLRTWLFTIARRLVLDRRRALRRRGEAIDLDEADAATEYDALDGVVADETVARLQAALAKLTPTQREVFLLRVNEGLSYKEIAEVASTTEGAARVHYHNAMRAVKELLDA